MDEKNIANAVAEILETIRRSHQPAKASQSSAGAEEGNYISDAPARSVPDSLDRLRLQVKYLIFDVEATRRENRYLRQMLEARRDPRRGDAQDEES